MVNIPDHVAPENEERYVDGIYRNIARNARKTTEKRRSSDPEFAALLTYIETQAEKGNPFFKSLDDTLNKRGKLSEGQEAAARRTMAENAARRAETRKRDAGSEFVGVVGKRQEFTAQVTGYTTREGIYGVSHIHFMKDAAGNVLFYSGSNKLADKGEQITFVASVKAHKEHEGVKSTTVQRPKLKENTNA